MNSAHVRVIGATVVGLLSACSSSGPDRSGSGPSEIRIVINADIRGLNPGVDRDANTDDVLGHIVEGLVAYREDLSLGPLLAETFSVSEDERVYTFKLRRGVRFHNDALMTSADVKWSWDRMLDPATKWLCRDWYDGSRGVNLESVAALDEQTVVFRLREPSAMFLHRMASFQCPAAILHPSSIVDGEWDQPVGTGPFRLKEWRRGEYVLLERFPGYASRGEAMDGLTGAKEPLVERIRWVIVPDLAAAKAAIYSRQVDLLYTLLPSDLAELKTSPGVTVHQAPSLAWSSLLTRRATRCCVTSESGARSPMPSTSTNWRSRSAKA